MSKRIIFITSALCIGIALAAYIPPVSARFATGLNTSQLSSTLDRVPGTDPCSSPVTSTLPIRLFLPLIVNGTVVTTTTVPNFSHIYILIMENHDYDSIIGNSSAPYLNCLATTFGLATNYSSLTHPSQPNYLALFSGSTQGVMDDATHYFPGQNVADQIEAKGKTWKVFAQNYPLNCSLVGSATGGADDPSGVYARKHNPAISFTDIITSPTRCANITDFSHFDPAAADYEMISPNLCNDTQTCPVATGDAFLKGFVPKILNSNAWTQGGVLFITYDENITGASPVVTTVISNFGKHGTTSSIAHDHYSLLRTVQDAWGLGCLNSSCSANNLAEFFQ